MLADHTEVVRALLRYRDIFDPRSGSILVPGKGATPFGRDPFRGGFIAGMEERAELLRRLRTLEERKRKVLCLWYMAALPVVQIARRVRVSRVHCYRLRNQALEEMARSPDEKPQASIPASVVADALRTIELERGDPARVPLLVGSGCIRPTP